MRHWLLGSGSFVTGPVLRGEQPSREEDEDAIEWSLVCGTVVPDDDAHLAHLHHAVDRDPSLIDVLDLELGEYADRDGAGADWVRGRS